MDRHDCSQKRYLPLSHITVEISHPAVNVLKEDKGRKYSNPSIKTQRRSL